MLWRFYFFSYEMYYQAKSTMFLNISQAIEKECKVRLVSQRETVGKHPTEDR